jgi:hypothetical protein
VRHVAHAVKYEKCSNILLGKPEGRRTLERPVHRWEDNIKMDFILDKAVGWLYQGQDGILWLASVNTIMSF